MELPEFELIQPGSLQEACSILGEHNRRAVLLAGGTALMVTLRYRLSKPTVVIGLKGLTALDYVSRNGSGGLSIGSMATLQTLEKSPLVLNEYAPLAQAVQLVAIPSIRDKATIGGNLCLDTRCIYYNQSEFWTGRGEKPNVLKPDEILVEVRIPTPGPGAAWAYEKLRVREGMDFPMAGVAVMVKRTPSGTIERVKVVLGAVGSSPAEVPKAAALLEGHKPTDDLLQSVSREAVDRAQAVGNLAMNASYRKKMVGGLVKRALRRALAMSPEK